MAASLVEGSADGKSRSASSHDEHYGRVFLEGSQIRLGSRRLDACDGFAAGLAAWTERVE